MGKIVITRTSDGQITTSCSNAKIDDIIVAQEMFVAVNNQIEVGKSFANKPSNLSIGSIRFSVNHIEEEE